MSVVVATFYKFVTIEDCEVLQRSLQSLCQDLEVYGTILLAEEGINATLSARQDPLDQVITQLRADRRFADIAVKYAIAEKPPFGRLKVKVKPEIVTLGQPDANPAEVVGTYVSPAEWNRLVSDPQVVVVDARNEYEVGIGSFKGAVNPHTESFRQLPDYLNTQLDPQQHRKVAMFCTGGIRCEKATAYLLKNGFDEVYHLQGGILEYLAEVPESESLWEGECFVFDERVAVGHGLKRGTYDLCYACGNPISKQDKVSPQYEAGISCPHCFAAVTPEQRAKRMMRKHQLKQLPEKTG